VVLSPNFPPFLLVGAFIHSLTSFFSPHGMFFFCSVLEGPSLCKKLRDVFTRECPQLRVFFHYDQRSLGSLRPVRLARQIRAVYSSRTAHFLLSPTDTFPFSIISLFFSFFRVQKQRCWRFIFLYLFLDSPHCWSTFSFQVSPEVIWPAR